MNWIPNEHELKSVSALPGPKRYEHWIKKVADQEVIWSLWDGTGWVLADDNNGQLLVPVWPHSRYAELCATGEWSTCSPKEIELDAWLQRWIPGMIRDKKMVAVFPVIGDKGVLVNPERIRTDLEEEISQYEE